MSSTPLPVLFPPPPSSSPSSKTNIIFIVIVIIIVVLIIFMFTKMNTMNKELKEVRSEVKELQTSSKMIQAIGQKLGLAVDEKGQIVDADEEEQEDGGVCEMKQPEEAQEFNPATILGQIPPDLMATMFASMTQPAARVEVEETGVDENKEQEKESVQVD